jgi:adenosyl cobinamide kinase/adenosyl cobinamide phosphate guanylyltransferase
LEYFMKASQVAAASALTQQVDACLKKFASTIHSSIRLSLLSNSLSASFVAGNWENVLYWATGLEVETGQQHAEQWIGLAQTTRWVAWYELHRHHDLERALRPHLKITRSTSPNALAVAIARLLDCETEQQEVEAVATIQTAIAQAQAAQPLPHLDLLVIWAEAKRLGKPIETIASKH